MDTQHFDHTKLLTRRGIHLLSSPFLTNFVKTKRIKVLSLGEHIRKLREDKKLPLRTVAAFLDIDQAILSKIETGKRKASREQIVQIAHYFKVKEKHLLITWLADKLVYEVEDEEVALKALKAAEEIIEYKAFLKVDRRKIIAQLKNTIKTFPQIEKAWVFGSFSRKDDKPGSDIDIAVKAEENFSYFDLAEIQEQLEKVLNRKVDIGFIDSLKPYVFENLKNDLKLVYEK